MESWVFRVLGPFDVVGPKGWVQMRSARQRTILAMLVLNANRLVVAERLIDGVWPESPPATAREQIYTCISRLRRALAAAGLDDRIRTRYPGYLLKVRNGELDLNAFERQVEACIETADNVVPTGEGVAGMRSALLLFRGDPFANVDSEVMRWAAQRIVERKMLLTERYIAAELQLNMHQEALAELAELVSEHPLHERLRALQMTALHQAGRRAEALTVYQKIRRELVSQLGIEPGEELRAVHVRILSDEGRSGGTAGTVRRGPVPRLLPREPGCFDARTKQLRQVRERVLAWAAAGRGGLVAISGRAGVGKTAFARQVGQELASCFEDGQLYADLVDREARPVSPGHVLGSFLRELGLSMDSIPQSVDERAEIYRSLLAGRRLLVLLDGATTEEQVSQLLPTDPTSLAVVTSRPRLGGLVGGLHVHLDPPDVDGAIKMLETMIGWDRVAAEPRAARELVLQCGRLPYALRLAAARLSSRPHWTIGRLTERLGDDCRRLDELSYHGYGVREIIMASYAALDPVDRCLFDRLALCPRPSFPEWVCAPLLDCDPDDALEALERLVDVQLVQASQDITGCRYYLDDLVMLVARDRIAMQQTGERDAAQRRLIATWLSLIDEVNRSDRGKILGQLGASAARYPLPRRWIRRLMPDPLAWLDRERSSIETAMRQAIEIEGEDMCWDLAVGVVVSRRNQHPSGADADRVSPDGAAAGVAESACQVMLRAGGSLDKIQSHLVRTRLKVADAGESAEPFAVAVIPASSGAGDGLVCDRSEPVSRDASCCNDHQLS